MKFRLFTLLLFLTASGLRAQVQFTTNNPRVDDVNDPDVTIQRVELTAQYTIIYMRFQSPEQRRLRRSLPFSLPMPNGRRFDPMDEGNNIGFQANSRLYVNEGEKSYKLIRAENIPADIRRRVSPGEQVDFVAYFERISPGYTTFDLFECKDHQEGLSKITCFNFWGVHIINPRKNDTYSQRTPKAAPPVQPRVQPRVIPPAPKPVEPTPQETAVAISGVTRDAKTKRPVAATVTYQLLSGAEISGETAADSIQSADATGKYQIPIDRRGVYVVKASAKGYFSQSDTLATNRISVTRNFDLTPIVVGAKITLKNIYFNASKYDLKPESYPELDRLASMMQDNSTMQIRLEGHTDTVGDFDSNVELSRNRVDEVKRYLVSKGIADSRIETVGYGPSRPINTNKGLKERPENRRVEMVIVKV